jgi:hypothetical protein
VKNDYGIEQEAWTLNGLEEPLKKQYLPTQASVYTLGLRCTGMLFM